MTFSVLVVDDSLTVRMDLVEGFEEEGFDTHGCSDLSSAREALTTRKFDVVVLDVELPDGDGIELLAELRRPGAPSQKVILLSRHAEVADRLKGFRTGADEYVGKPYDKGFVLSRAKQLALAEAKEADLENPRLLLIEDSDTFAFEMRQALESAGYTVRRAATGEEGLRIAALEYPSLVIADGVLPGIDGFTVIRRIRLDPLLRHIPCVMLTGEESGKAEVEAYEAGADAYIRKEDGFPVILARLRAAQKGVVERPLTLQPDAYLGPKRILAVDDSSTYLNALSDALRHDGYDLILAHSGEEALELLTFERVDCILLDVIMPGIGGHETCQRIKEAAGLREIPLIMLTAADSREAIMHGLRAGADDYISKVADFEVLRARVRAQLRRRQADEESRMFRQRLLRAELEAAEARAAAELAAAKARAEEEFRRQAEFLALVIRSADAGTWLWDLATGQHQWSPQMFRLFDVPPDLTPSRERWVNTVHPDDRPETLRRLEEAIEGHSTLDHEHRVVHRDGQIRWIRVVGSASYDTAGRAERVAGFCLDMTRRREAEEELREARDAADKANRAKSRFLANMSHEIRTPMNAILGFAQLLLGDSSLTSGQREQVRAISRSGEHLLALINDILEISRIEAGRATLNTAEVDLHLLLQTVEELFRFKTAEKGLALRFECTDIPKYVETDELRLREVLINLLGNAVKFTSRGGVTVRARSEVIKEGASRLHFDVEDTGPGIPEGELSSLFREFEQARSGREARTGTGLGLAISRGFARLMGGDITVESRPGEGSIFHASVSVKAASKAPQRAVEPPRHGVRRLVPGPARRKVLVVDDVEENLQVASAMLSNAGFEVKTCMDGREAIRLFQEWSPDLIMMDLLMPVLSGLDAIRLIRGLPQGRAVPIVAVTASCLDDVSDQVRAAGGNGFISKPFHEADLLDTAERLLGCRFAVSSPPVKEVEASRATRLDVTELLRLEMLQAVERADLDRLNELAETLAATDPPGAQTLRDLAENFEYGQIRRLLSADDRETKGDH